MRALLSTICLTFVFLTPLAASAEESSYGIYFGDGLRHLVEGEYDRAAEALFRAYGLKPSATVMELIVEAYDQMGRCDVAARQVEFFQRFHPEEPAPTLARCQERRTEVARLVPLIPRVELLPSSFQVRAQVARLTDPSATFRVYHSEDGIYQVWVRRDADADDAEPRTPLRLEVYVPRVP